MRLLAELLAKYHALQTNSEAWSECRGKQNAGVGAVVLCPCFSEVHKDIHLWGEGCPMLSGPFQAPIVDSLQHLAVFFC